MTLPHYELDGSNFQDLAGFARHFSSVVLEGHTWGGSLDAFNDILRGGFGTPGGGFVLRVTHTAAARRALGYSETVRWFEERAKTCHPSNRARLVARTKDARLGIGETLFDMIVDIIRDHGPGGTRLEDNVVLELDEPT